MPATQEFFSMQGRVAIGLRNADGTRQPARFVYDSSKLEWAFSVDKTDIPEHTSGARGLAATLTTKKTMKVNVTLGELNDGNVELALGGTIENVVGGTVTAEALGDVKVGDMVALEFAKVSAVTLTAAAALVEGTDYKLSATTGVVTFLTANTGVSAAYTYAAFSLVTALTGARPDTYILFDGLNTVDGAIARVRGEVYRISLDPATTFSLIQDDVGNLELSGDARNDPVRADDSKYGGYARLMYLDPAT